MKPKSQSTPAPIAWVASYPKAGNTWMRLMLMHLVHAEGRRWTPDRPLLSTATNPIHRAHIEELCLIDASLLSAAECDLLRPRLYETAAAKGEHGHVEQHFFKVHDAYRRNTAGQPVLGGSPGQKAVYLVRDPRDVVVSLAAFTNQSLADTVAFMNRADACVATSTRQFNRQIHQRLLDWSGHVRSWLDQQQMPVLLVRYEDLRAAPTVWLQRVSGFLGLETCVAQLEHAVRMTSFERLREAEAQHGFCEHPGLGTARFFRRGQPGEWCEALDPQLVRAIESAHGAMMQQLGYSLRCNDEQLSAGIRARDEQRV